MSARALLDLARAKGVMMATAESCTGGMVTAALTDVPGSSVAVERGFVIYSNAAKMEMLGVQMATLEAHGAVSEEVAAEMAREFGLSGEAFSQTGKINGAATDKGHRHNLDYARHLTAMGEAHDMLDAARMRALTGTTYYQSGLFTPGAAMIQPALFVRGVAQGLISNRVSIHEESPVISLTRNGDWVAETPKGRVTAPQVILAVNGHLQSFGHMAGRLMHVFTYASMTERLSAAQVARLGGAAVWGLTPADPLGTTVRRIAGTGGDRIVIRNRFTFDPSMEISEARMGRVGRDHDKSFKARFPMLDGVEMEHRWGGRLCLSLNGVSAFGQVDDRIYSACCQNGLGTTKGTLSGMCAADLAAQGNSPFVAELQSEDAPKKLPMAPIAQIGATLTLRWKEWRAGKEL